MRKKLAVSAMTCELVAGVDTRRDLHLNLAPVRAGHHNALAYAQRQQHQSMSSQPYGTQIVDLRVQPEAI